VCVSERVLARESESESEINCHSKVMHYYVSNCLSGGVAMSPGTEFANLFDAIPVSAPHLHAIGLGLLIGCLLPT
jgi:hypothetical protein